MLLLLLLLQGCSSVCWLLLPAEAAAPTLPLQLLLQQDTVASLASIPKLLIDSKTNPAKPFATDIPWLCCFQHFCCRNG
jgi:hypothetical protein